MGMTPRERFLATASFGEVGRPFRLETIGFWKETLERWHQEGLPPEVDDELSAFIHFGVDFQIPVTLGADQHPGFDPLFEEEVFEVQAGMDVLEVRGNWPNHFVIWGGIDKRVLAKGRAAIEEEVVRVIPPMLRQRGYIPAIDHSVPPDVPLENWLYFFELVRSIGQG